MVNWFIACRYLTFVALLCAATSSALSDSIVVATSNDLTVTTTATRTWVTCPENHGATISLAADGCMITPGPELFVLESEDTEGGVGDDNDNFIAKTITETVNGTITAGTTSYFLSKTKAAQGNSNPNNKTTKKGKNT